MPFSSSHVSKGLMATRRNTDERKGCSVSGIRGYIASFKRVASTPSLYTHAPPAILLSRCQCEVEVMVPC